MELNLPIFYFIACGFGGIIRKPFPTSGYRGIYPCVFIVLVWFLFFFYFTLDPLGIYSYVVGGMGLI